MSGYTDDPQLRAGMMLGYVMLTGKPAPWADADPYATAVLAGWFQPMFESMEHLQRTLRIRFRHARYQHRYLGLNVAHPGVSSKAASRRWEREHTGWDA